MNTNEVKKIIIKDTMLYLPARIIEGVIGLITITMYTGFFGREVYGSYSLVTSTVNIGSLLLVGWLIQSVFRYANTFDHGKKRTLFYSTSFTLWLTINSGVLLLGLIGTMIIGRGSERWLTELYLLSILMFVTYNTSQVLLSILTATRKTKLLLVLSIFSVSAKLCLTSLLVYRFKTNSITPATAVISNIIIDFIVVIVIVLRIHLYKWITFRLFSKKILKKLLTYSIPLVGVNVTTSVLSLSDRYVITSVLGREAVGIYSANYTISSSVFTLILAGVMRGVYPMILKTWRQNNKEQTENLLSNAVRYYLIVSMPALMGICILAQTISRLFLNENFHEQGFVITLVAVGMFLFGLVEYTNKAWELTSNTKPLLYNASVSMILNLVLNIVFIPLYGYRIAAVTTAFSYFVYFILSLVRGRKILKISFRFTSIVKITFSCIVMGISVYLPVNYLSPSVVALPFIILAGMVIYFTCLYAGREIDNEVNVIVNRIKSFKNNSDV